MTARAAEPWRSATLHAQLGRTARQSPATVALKVEGTMRTYAELDERVSRLANALIARGIVRGDRVAVLMLNRLELVESYFAVLRAGGICVPVNFRLAEAEVAYILKDCGASLVLCDAETWPLAKVAPMVPVIVCGTESPVGAHALEDVIAEAAPDPPDMQLSEHDPAFIMYTSGTTGHPKGAVLSHLNLMLNTMNMIAALEISAGDRRWLAGLPLFHIGGLNGILPFLHLGGTCVILGSGDFDAARTVEIMDRERITSCFFVPTQWQAICEVPGLDQRELALKRISWGASPIPAPTLAAILRLFPGIRAYNVFGQTEMSSITCAMRADAVPEKAASVGRPVPGVEVRIVDDEGRDVAPGGAGEIVYRGATVMLGYWNNPAATEEAFAGGWFHSGDVVHADEDGYLYVVDRKKDMIISGGENIYCSEVEAVLHTHPKLREAAVIGVPHPKWVETPVAVVSLVPGCALKEQELIEWCRGQLASYKKPTRMHVVDSLPRNASGKVLKNRLREQFSAASPLAK